VAALGTPGIEHATATDGAHAGAKPMRAGSVQVAGLKGALHGRVIQKKGWQKGAEVCGRPLAWSTLRAAKSTPSQAPARGKLAHRTGDLNRIGFRRGSH